MWTDRAFSAQAVADLGKGVGVSGNSLTNNSPLDLRGAVWVQDSRVWSLGDLKKGGSVQVSGQGNATSGANLPGAITSAANLGKIFDASTLSNSIPNNALQLALGDEVGKLNTGAMLVAWGKTPLAPVRVGDARGDNITLVILRAPKLSGKLAAREATVQPVSFEPFDATAPNDPMGGGFRIYKAILPAQNDLVLKARGLGIGPNPNEPPPRGRFGRGAVPTPTPKPKAGDGPITWVSFEVLDARDGKWKPLAGQMQRDSSPARGWNFRARIDPKMARQPDRALSVRARLANQQARVSSIKIG